MNKISISKICLLTFFIIMNTSIFGISDQFPNNNHVRPTNELTEHQIRKYEGRLNELIEQNMNELNDPVKEIQKTLKLTLKHWYIPVSATALGIAGMTLTMAFFRQ